MIRFLLFLLVMLLPLVATAQETVTIRIRDFGRGMELSGPPYAGDPEALSYSLNMYSLAPGTRTIRPGTRKITTFAANDFGMSSIVDFRVKEDSSSVVFTAGGKWYDIKYGEFRYAVDGGKGPIWLAGPTFDSGAEIRPYPSGTAIERWNGHDTLVGTGTRWVRDLQSGDTIVLGGDIFTVKYVMGDTRFRAEEDATVDSVSTDYEVTRSYVTGGADPYLHQYGDFLFTGGPSDAPQVIYPAESVNYIKPMGIVDSVFIDAIYTAPYIDSVWERNYDTTATGDSAHVLWIRVVDRNQRWRADEWATTSEGDPTAFYFCFGGDFVGDTATWGKTYRIISNNDSALQLRTLMFNAALRASETNDLGVPLGSSVMDAMIGTWGYIYSAAGLAREVVANDVTPLVKVRAGGAVFSTVAPAIADTANQDKFNYGHYFIKILGEVPTKSLSTDSVWQTRTQETRTVLGLPSVPTGGILITLTVEEYCGTSRPDWFERPGPFCEEYFRMVYKVKIPAYQTTHGSLPRWFGIRHAYWKNDTLNFVTDFSSDPTASIVTTEDWMIYEVSLPIWSGVTSFNRQLVGWGDSTHSSLISFSEYEEPLRFVPTSDVFIGSDISEPIVAMVPYDDQLVIFKFGSILSYPGFSELSLTYGAVSPEGVLGLDKEYYWVAADGVYKMQRRDFNGYTNTKISAVLDPAFNRWNTTQFGVNVVPFSFSAADLRGSVLVYNKRDNHIYMFVSGACLTYSLYVNQWDGYFDVGATAAVWAVVQDTARIVYGIGDSSIVLSIDYAFTDWDTTHVVGDSGRINTEIRGKWFSVPGSEGETVSRFVKLRFLGRGIGAPTTLDSAFVIIVDEDGNENKSGDLTFLSIYPDEAAEGGKTIFWDTTGRVSTKWRYVIKTYGGVAGSIFQPYELDMVFLPLRKDD